MRRARSRPAAPSCSVLYAALWDVGVDPVTLELCRLRMATLIGSAADLAMRQPERRRRRPDRGSRRGAPGVADLGAVHRRATLRDSAFAEQFVIDAHGFTDDDMAGDARALHRPATRHADHRRRHVRRARASAVRRELTDTT